MSGLLWFLIILNAYVLLVYLAARTGLLARYNIGLLGPALMFRTQRGKGVIEWLSKARRFHIVAGGFGAALTLLVMLGITALLVIQVPALFEIPAERAPKASEILALPGINPLIPLTYGIVALIVAIVIHEFAHGVLARAQNMGVKSLGMLYLIVPIGAFVEPDEEQLKASPRHARMRVYAAGPTSNLASALLFGLLFSGVFMAAAVPVADGIGLNHITENGPADQAGLEPGWIITHVNGTRVRSFDEFSAALNVTRAGQNITVRVAEHGDVALCLGDKSEAGNVTDLGPGYDFCQLATPRAPDSDANATGDNGTVAPPAPPAKGFLGVEAYPLSPTRLRELLVHPFSDLTGFVLYIALPFTGFTPMEAPLTDMFTVPVGDGAMATLWWVTANIVYWIMWISLMLGLTNALPAVPLDGGYLFRDFVEGIIAKVRPALTEARRAVWVKRTSVVVSFAILGLILLQFIAPRLPKGLFG